MNKMGVTGLLDTTFSPTVQDFGLSRRLKSCTVVPKCGLGRLKCCTVVPKCGLGPNLQKRSQIVSASLKLGSDSADLSNRRRSH